MEAKVLYILTSVWVLRTQNAVEICIFNVFNGKKLKKGEKAINLQQNLGKNVCFLSLHQNAG